MNEGVLLYLLWLRWLKWYIDGRRHLMHLYLFFNLILFVKCDDLYLTDVLFIIDILKLISTEADVPTDGSVILSIDTILLMMTWRLYWWPSRSIIHCLANLTSMTGRENPHWNVRCNDSLRGSLSLAVFIIQYYGSKPVKYLFKRRDIVDVSMILADDVKPCWRWPMWYLWLLFSDPILSCRVRNTSWRQWLLWRQCNDREKLANGVMKPANGYYQWPLMCGWEILFNGQ